MQDRLDTAFRMLKIGKLSCSDVIKIIYEEPSSSSLPGKNDKQHESMEDIMKELDSLIGLNDVKKLVKEIQAFASIQKRRREEKRL
jgi:stage V sporulation protein K